MFHRYVTRTYKGILCNARNIKSRSQLEEIFPGLRAHYADIPDELIDEFVTNPAQQLDHYAAKTGNFELFVSPESVLDNVPLAVHMDGHGFFRMFGGPANQSSAAR